MNLTDRDVNQTKLNDAQTITDREEMMADILQPLPEGWECVKRTDQHVVWHKGEEYSVTYMDIGTRDVELWQVERMHRTEDGDEVYIAGFPTERAEAENLALIQMYKF